MSAPTAEESARFTPVELRAPRGSSHVEIVWEDGKVTHYETDVRKRFPSLSKRSNLTFLSVVWQSPARR